VRESKVGKIANHEYYGINYASDCASSREAETLRLIMLDGAELPHGHGCSQHAQDSKNY